MKTNANVGWRTRTVFEHCGCEKYLAANKSIDADAASTVIRYPLRWHHLGLVMWYPGRGP